MIKAKAKKKPGRKPIKRDVKQIAAPVEQVEVLEIKRTAALVAIDPQALIDHAIEKGLPLEAMERLLAMRKELKAEWARERFFDDLAKFQAACPIIGKSKEVNGKDGKLRYRFAPLNEIVEQVKKPLERFGFSYTVVTKQTEKAVTAICNAHHVDGHTESSEFTIPIDPEAYMNDAQKIASAMTYATRYAFRNAFGVVTGDLDDDGQLGGGDGEDRKTEIRPPQTRNVTPSAPAASVPKGPYAEIMSALNERVKSKEGTVVALFGGGEAAEWKHKADQYKNDPEGLQRVQQELESFAAPRRKSVKGEA